MPAERLLQPTLINAAASGFDGIFDASTAEPNTHMLPILDNKLYTVVNLHQLLIIIIIIIIIINFFFFPLGPGIFNNSSFYQRLTTFSSC